MEQAVATSTTKRLTKLSHLGLLILAVPAALVVVVLQSLEMGLIPVAGFLAMVVVVSFLAKVKRRLLAVTLLITWYLPGHLVQGGALESQMWLRWLSYLVIVAAAGIVFFSTAASERRFHPTFLSIPIAALIIAAIASALVNGVELLDLLFYLVLYLRYPLFFLALIKAGYGEEDFSSLASFFLILALIQVPEVVFRYVALGARGDSLCGTLGPLGTFMLGVFFIYACCLIAGRVVAEKFRLRFLLVMGALLVPSVLGEIKALLLFGPLCVLVVLLPPFKDGGAFRRVATGVLVVTIAVCVLTVWAAFWESDDWLTPMVRSIGGEGIVTDGATYGNYQYINRVDWTVTAFDYLAERGDLWLGMGPGSSSLGNLTGTPGKMSALGLGIGKTQVTSVLWDVGLLGLAAFFLMLLVVLSFVIKAAKAAGGATAPLLHAMVGIWFFYALVGPHYAEVWRAEASSFLFWVGAAAAYNFNFVRSRDESSRWGAERSLSSVASGENREAVSFQ